jgi:catechol 2,3-dioxygenase-like lactoylglutathione lyase family enzyme
MSIVFGGIRQLGFVVRDAEAALHAFKRVGVGPFFTMHFTMDDFVYRGRPGAAPEVTLYFAHSGPLQVEIVQLHNDVPSGYAEFLDSGREGPQHVASWFADPAQYDAKRQELLKRGFVLVHEGASREMGARFAYFETDLPGGLMFEIAEALIPGVADGIRLMEEAARAWDGGEILAAEMRR